MPGTKGRSGGDRRSMGPDEWPADGGPSRPTGLSKDEQAVWTTITDQLPPAILRRCDQHQLAILCRLIVREKALAEVLRKDPADHAAGRAYLGTVQHISRLSAAYGLSPADRRRLKVQEPVEGESVFEELLARMSNPN